MSLNEIKIKNNCMVCHAPADGMKFKITIKETGLSEIIGREEIMFRLIGRRNRPQDLSDLMAGKTVHADYCDYQKLSDWEGLK